MKRCISLFLAVLMLLMQLPVSAELSSGMKDISATSDGTTAVIRTNDPFAKMWLKSQDFICAEEWNYEVSVFSGSDTTEYIEIRSRCGDKIYEPQEIILAPGATVTRQGVMTEMPQGEQTLSIEVVRNDGAVLASYSKTIPVMRPEEIGYLSDFTRKVGMSGGSGTSIFVDWEWINLQSFRKQWTWQSTEAQEGVYTGLNEFEPELERANMNNSDYVFLLAYNNPIYSGNTNNKKGPSTKREFDAYAEYAKVLAKKYQSVNYYEIWNEPNGMWNPSNTTDYAYIAEVAKNEIKKINENSETLIGSVANGDYGYVDEALKAGLYPNMDIVANHPYIRPSKVDDAYHGILSGMNSVITKYGGWKEQAITEVGWPTHNAGISKEQAEIEQAKQIIVADYYGVMQNQLYMNADVLSGHNPDDSEQNFGVFFSTTGFKPGAYSVKQVVDKTNGAVFYGKIIFTDHPNIEAYLYLRDGQLTLILWSTEGEQVIDFGNETVSCEDMRGNKIGTAKSFTIGESPVYVYGLSKSWLIRSLQESSEKYLDIYMQEAFEDSLNKKGWDKACGIMQRTADNAGKLSENGQFPSEEEALSAIDKNYEILTELIELYEAEELDISIEQLTGLLYVNNWIAKMLDCVYMMTVDSAEDYIPNSMDKVKSARKYLTEKVGEKTLTYSSVIIDYAEEMAEKAMNIKSLKGTNPMKAGVIKAWDVMADRLLNMALKLADAEKPQHHNVLLQLPSSECVVELSVENTVNASLYNYRKTEALKGYVDIISPGGEVIGSSEELVLAAGKNCAVPIKVLMRELEEGTYKIRFFENDECIIERTAKIKSKVVYDVELKNAECTFDELDEVSIVCSNYRDEAFEGKVKLEPLCNWKLSESDVKDIVLPENGSVNVSWKIDSKERVSFNCYPFRITIYNKAGEVLWQQIQMLNFTVIVKSDKRMSTADFDGDIESWKDAYPVYESIPDEPDSADAWQDKGYYTRMLSKWDNNNLYLLFDVYDWYHENRQADANIWNGDAIQICFDPLNDAYEGQQPAGYGSDDYEYGFAYNEKEGNTVYAWKDAVTGKENKKPSDWVSVVRNEDIGLTRYFAAIPKENISPLVFNDGSCFGMDVLYANSNVGTRADYVTFANAIPKGKFPERCWDFYLREDKSTTDMVEVANAIPTSLEGLQSSGNQSAVSKFTDIGGHWAEKDINAFALSGYVNGYEDNTFRPENNVTRAEFVHIFIEMVRNGGYYPFSYTDFKDVNIYSWYGGSVARAEKYGFLSTELFGEYFRPDKFITREEAFTLVNNWYRTKGRNTDEYIPLYKFADCDEISDWAAAAAFQNLCNHGIVSGYGDYLMPKGAITRAEAVSMLKRALK